METRDKDYIAAGAVNWATQMSFEPVRVGIMVELHSDLNETIEKSRNFTLHLLGKGQEELVKKFAKDTKVQNGELNSVGFKIGENGAPLLEEGIGYIECNVVDRFTVGDHSLFVGELVDSELTGDKDPICTMETEMYYKG
jgi:flavin reductase (DIM6/NTAB) family NADH-FMN oxidoreductase RutF